MKTPWEYWKKAFYAWENQTAKYMEQVLANPLVLKPSGRILGEVMKTKAASDKAMRQLWGTLGLPTKHDQERTLHALNQLQSKLYDLEERLDALQEEREKKSRPPID